MRLPLYLICKNLLKRSAPKRFNVRFFSFLGTHHLSTSPCILSRPRTAVRLSALGTIVTLNIYAVITGGAHPDVMCFSSMSMFDVAAHGVRRTVPLNHTPDKFYLSPRYLQASICSSHHSYVVESFTEGFVAYGLPISENATGISYRTLPVIGYVGACVPEIHCDFSFSSSAI